MMKSLSLLLGLSVAYGSLNVIQDGSNCPFAESYNTIDEYLLRHPNTDIDKLKAVSGTRINLTDAQNNNGAACLDGSVPVMYWRPGTGDGVNKFHVCITLYVILYNYTTVLI